MSRRNRKKSGAYSGLERHVRTGKTLTPQLLTLPQLVLTSWIKDRLPDLLWAALIITQRPRFEALDIFRQALAFVRDDAVARDRPLDVTLSGLAEWDWDLRKKFIEKLATLAPDALTPLLLLDDLPSKDLWSLCLQGRPTEEHWSTLGEAVLAVLDHQSQEATDCRWVRVIFQVIIGRMQFPRSMINIAEEIFYYPDKGDQRAVRPSIRASEGGLDVLTEGQKKAWPTNFWAQCMRDTACIVDESLDSVALIKVGTTVARVRTVRDRLRNHSFETRGTTAVDSRHDTVFSSGLFALALVEELLSPGIGQSLMGRMAVRSLSEVYVSLSYLLVKDDPELWQSFRTYGAGQMKLSFLHLDRLGGTEFVDVNRLEILANEDLWLEYLPVNLGHWSKATARTLAEEANVRDIYDRFYPWGSAYVHGHWGAMRDSVMITCFNPLHRLHRVARSRARPLEDVVPDAAFLTDKILERVEEAYPGFSLRLGV